jgi:hypothetical protein
MIPFVGEWKKVFQDKVKVLDDLIFEEGALYSFEVVDFMKYLGKKLSEVSFLIAEYELRKKDEARKEK